MIVTVPNLTQQISGASLGASGSGACLLPACLPAWMPGCCLTLVGVVLCGVYLPRVPLSFCHAAQAPAASLVPHVVRICEAAATPLMGSVRVSRSLQENAAITLGRMAMVCPDQVRGGCGAPQTADFEASRSIHSYSNRGKHTSHVWPVILRPTAWISSQSSCICMRFICSSHGLHIH